MTFVVGNAAVINDGGGGDQGEKKGVRIDMNKKEILDAK